MNNHFDWSRFVVRINIDAPAQKLYSSWATSEGMEFWFLRLCEYTTKGGKLLAQPDAANQGDRYKFLWHGWPDETVEFGEILEANGTDSQLIVDMSICVFCILNYCLISWCPNRADPNLP